MKLQLWNDQFSFTQVLFYLDDSRFEYDWKSSKEPNFPTLWIAKYVGHQWCEVSIFLNSESKKNQMNLGIKC